MNKDRLQRITLTEQLAASRVLPVVTAFDVDSTVKLATVLAENGMTALEITLRTECALASLHAVKKAVPGLVVAAGTVISGLEMKEAVKAGADFCVSPGISASLLVAANEQAIPFLPGVATASEIMLGIEYGFDVFKLFPAVASGGVDLLNALRGPFPAIRFCPTGGMTRQNFRDYLALPNVICCGGSWMVTEKLVRAGDWDEIAALAQEAASRAFD